MAASGSLLQFSCFHTFKAPDGHVRDLFPEEVEKATNLDGFASKLDKFMEGCYDGYMLPQLLIFRGLPSPASGRKHKWGAGSYAEVHWGSWLATVRAGYWVPLGLIQ